MPVTISYDLTNVSSQRRTYVRSMFERFGWKRLGGSVFRYGRARGADDWLNDIVPALMFFRSYALKHNIKIRFFTLDASGVARIDHSNSDKLLGKQPRSGVDLWLRKPTNFQSSESRIRRFVDSAVNVLN